MRRTNLKTLLFAIATAATLGVMSARAADCGESAVGFNEWLELVQESSDSRRCFASSRQCGPEQRRL